MIVNRFQKVLHCCIDEAQCTFVPRRLIADNIITAYEILYSMKLRRLGKEGSFALKLDMSNVMIVLNGYSLKLCLEGWVLWNIGSRKLCDV